MPPPPVDATDHSEDFEQLAGLSALRALEPDDELRFEQHLAHCEQCRLIVRLDRETLSRVALATPEMDASPDFKERLMRRAAAELAAGAPGSTGTPAATDVPAAPIPLRPPSNVVPLWRRPFISALAAVLVLGIATASVLTYQNQVVAEYQLSGNAPGSAVVIVKRSGAAELEMHNVPDPPAGHVYEAWIIPPNQQPVPAGTTSHGQANLPLAQPPRGATIAITEEPAPGTDAPTSPPLMAAVLA